LQAQAARAAVLASLPSVDVVTLFAPGGAASLARAIRPDVLICDEAQGLSAPLAQEWGGEVKRLRAEAAAAE
jgi:D-beta-D-heptose 7-phosphate kinase/D-beta-D-heptose 1-phosphate adenosyltransferase